MTRSDKIFDNIILNNTIVYKYYTLWLQKAKNGDITKEDMLIEIISALVRENEELNFQLVNYKQYHADIVGILRGGM